MAFLDRLSKGVSKAADQAKFEADKLRKQQAINSELSKLKDQLASAKGDIADKVLELKQAGTLAVPELDSLIADAQALAEQAAAKEAELAAVKAMEYEEKAPAAGPAPAGPAPQAPQAGGTPKFCPNCGAALAEGAKFCPECGTKIG
jgi:peptidoglycan hydrolase CwlO-like protein